MDQMDGVLTEDDIIRMIAKNPELQTMLEFFMENKTKLQAKAVENDLFAEKRNLSEYAAVQRLLYPTVNSSPESSVDSEINSLQDEISRLDKMIEIKQ